MKIKVFEFMKKLLVFFFSLVVCSSYADEIRGQLRSAGNASQYPNVGYITVFDSTKVDVMSSGLSYVNTRMLHKILRPKGALDLRSIILDYDPLSAWIEFKKIKVWKKNGEEIDVSLDEVYDYPAYSHMIYWGARQKMVEIGRIEPGDGIEIEYRRKGYTYALLKNEEEKYIPPMRGHFYDIVPFYSKVPVLIKYYAITIPSDKNIQYKIFNTEDINIQKSALEGKNLLEFSLMRFSPIERESGMVSISDVAPKVLLSTAKDWEAKSRWFYKVNEDYKSFESFPELDKLVNKILINAKSEYDSIAFLTHWVADNMRYCGVSMGKGEGYTLHNSKMNYYDRCGVCKDKAGMLISMLRSAGFESYPAMTMAGSRIEDIPADQFNHCVSLVKVKSGKFKILDPTWVPFVRELWSSAEQQQNYLPGIPGGADLQITPVSNPQNHFVNIDVKSSLGEDGTLRGKMQMIAEGQSDSGFRRYFVSSLKTRWNNIISEMFYKVDQRIVIDSINYGNPYDYTKPFYIYMSFTIPNYAIIGDKEIIMESFASRLFNDRFFHLRINTSSENRNYGFKDRCSRFIKVNESIELPKECKLSYYPKVDMISSKIASFKGGYDLVGKTLNLSLNVTLNKRKYLKEDWSQFRDVVNSHKLFINKPVILKVDN